MALVVVMEDDAGTRMLVGSVLQKDGHEVVVLEDGGYSRHPADLAAGARPHAHRHDHRRRRLHHQAVLTSSAWRPN